MQIRLATLAALAALTFATAACNTVSGAGQDLEDASRDVDQEL